jgi:CheY-like chemotaxis protein
VPPPAIGRALPTPPVRLPVPGREEPAADPAAPAARTVASSRGAPAAGPSNLLAFPVSSLEPPISQRLRVLVVDDSPTVRRQLGVAFDRMGITCDSVESGAQALEKLAEQHFDLALLDVVMPDMDGYQLTRAIKRNRQWRQLPIIILTSRSSPFDLARGALAGCDTYLTKPVPYRALEAAVIKQLRRALAIDDLSGLVRTATQPVAPSMAEEPPSAPRGVMARLFRR